jgi:hypothetical protein
MSLLRKEYDERNGKDLYPTFFFILVTFAAIALFSVGFFAISRTFPVLGEIDTLVMLLGIAYAVATFVSTIICIASASFGSVAVIVAFANLGIITMSTLYGMIFDSARNKPTVFTWIGLALAATVMVLNLLEGRQGGDATDARKKRVFRLFCLGIFFSNGPALVILSALTKYRPLFGENGIHFLFLYSAICAVAALVCLGVIIFHRKSATADKGEARAATVPHISAISIAIILLYSVAMMGSEWMALVNTAQLPIIVQAPLSFAIPVVLLTVTERLIYKTPITKSVLVKLLLCLCCCTLFVL